MALGRGGWPLKNVARPGTWRLVRWLNPTFGGKKAVGKRWGRKAEQSRAVESKGGDGCGGRLLVLLFRLYYLMAVGDVESEDIDIDPSQPLLADATREESPFYYLWAVLSIDVPVERMSIYRSEPFRFSQ